MKEDQGAVPLASSPSATTERETQTLQLIESASERLRTYLDTNGPLVLRLNERDLLLKRVYEWLAKNRIAYNDERRGLDAACQEPTGRMLAHSLGEEIGRLQSELASVQRALAADSEELKRLRKWYDEAIDLAFEVRRWRDKSRELETELDARTAERDALRMVIEKESASLADYANETEWFSERVIRAAAARLRAALTPPGETK